MARILIDDVDLYLYVSEPNYTIVGSNEYGETIAIVNDDGLAELANNDCHEYREAN